MLKNISVKKCVELFGVKKFRVKKISVKIDDVLNPSVHTIQKLGFLVNLLNFEELEGI